MHYYAYRNLLHLGWDRHWLIAGLWVLALLVPVIRFAHLKWKNAFLEGFYWIGAIWAGALFMLNFWFWIANIFRSIFHHFHLEIASDPGPWVATAFSAVILMTIWGFISVKRGPFHVNFSLDRSKRYGKNQSLRLVQISDVHLGITLGIPFLEKLVKRMNALEPDLVLITGDFFDPEFSHDLAASETLKKIISREGVFAVSGNHEFYAGLPRFTAMMDQGGVHVLNNETKITKSGLQVSGIHDRTAKRFPHFGVVSDLDKAIASIDSNAPSILLAHQPKNFESAIAKKVDVIFSGHTHGGQIFPFRFLVSMVFKYLSGLYPLGEHTQLIVNSGTGFWGPPLRVATESQIVVVDLKF